MNIPGQIKKLQTALSVKNRIIKINTYQFYSQEQSRFIKCYSLVEKLPKLNRKGEIVVKDVELLKTCSQIEVLKYLVEQYNEVKDDDT